MKYKSFEAGPEERLIVVSSLEFIRKLNMNSCIINVKLTASIRHIIHSTLIGDSFGNIIMHVHSK